MTTDDFAETRRNLAAAETALARLRAQYDVLMNAFKFDEARDLMARIEAAEREQALLAAALPPAPATPAPAASFRRRPLARRRRR